MQVVLLGTGVLVPNPDRSMAATLVIARDQALLVDTGSNCFVRLSEARIANVNAVLFTHFHSDHISGLVDYADARCR